MVSLYTFKVSIYMNVLSCSYVKHWCELLLLSVAAMTSCMSFLLPMSTLFRRECYNILFPLRHEATTSSNEGDTPMDSVSTPSDHPPEFRQVVLHAQNQIILTKVLTQDKEKVGGNWMVTRAWSGRSESYCNTTSVCDMHI